MESSTNFCRFCQANPGKYTCPRCNADYCSVSCYRSTNHSNCSEAFYKECVEEHLKTEEPDQERRNRMVEILKRNYLNNDSGSESDDSDDDINLEDRLKGIDLDDTEEVWTKLTLEERREFLDLANAGDITKLVPIWDPWWSKVYPKPKVTFVDSSNSDDEYKYSCPAIKTNMPSLNNISKSNPSPLVFNNILNIVAAYVVVTRFYNGEHRQSSEDASSLLLDLCENLSNNVVFDNVDTALDSVARESTESEIVAAARENINQMRSDVAKIALGPNEDEPSFYILAALSDIDSLLNEAVKVPKSHSLSVNKKAKLPSVFEKKSEIKYTKKQFTLAEKKIQYCLSWVSKCYFDVINEFKKSLPT